MRCHAGSTPVRDETHRESTYTCLFLGNLWDPGLHHLQQVRNTSLPTAASDCTAAWRRRTKAYESSMRTCQHRRPPIRRWLAVVKSRGLGLKAWLGPGGAAPWLRRRLLAKRSRTLSGTRGLHLATDAARTPRAFHRRPLRSICRDRGVDTSLGLQGSLSVPVWVL